MKEALMLLENKLKILQVCKQLVLLNKRKFFIIRKIAKLIILDEADNMTKSA
jgi:hypothetical protein